MGCNDGTGSIWFSSVPSHKHVERLVRKEGRECFDCLSDHQSLRQSFL
jgi:hypothetical protein